MKKSILFNFLVDKRNNKINVERFFEAPIDLVWSAWTESELLDQWWAPKPYKAITKSMNFNAGGLWLYYMLGPEGDKHWCRFDYQEITPQQQFVAMDAFCDENGVISDGKPRVKWENNFSAQEDTTIVNCELAFENLADLEAIIGMGLKEGFTAALENLDQYIAAQFYLRKRNKPNNKARVASYVNFDGQTEEAFNFYRAAFKNEFINGIKRFEEAPSSPDQPPIADSLKKMVLHVELPLLGGHILMGTDAPKEMGFTLSRGNNMHIQLEPESKEEAERLFGELSEGGEIDMPLQDMFWGAYYGSFTDKFGINWMINYQPR